ncbi:MAG: uncharacterized protein QOF33_3543 [Thermomicrobiales bacterium]|jgi:hypothetical protein|nr:uncharacterized protein [Thermomicrobiales bacterium]
MERSRRKSGNIVVGAHGGAPAWGHDASRSSVRRRTAVLGSNNIQYNTDPIAIGVIEPSTSVCRACNLARGYIYTGGIYSIDDLYGLTCPWCISDGTANERLDAMFNDDFGVGHGNGWEPVDRSIVDEIAYRARASRVGKANSGGPTATIPLPLTVTRAMKN